MKKFELTDEPCCENCAFAEWEDRYRTDKTRYYCTHCGSEHCFQWVEHTDLCPLWTRQTRLSKYYNAY